MGLLLIIDVSIYIRIRDYVCTYEQYLVSIWVVVFVVFLHIILLWLFSLYVCVEEFVRSVGDQLAISRV